MNKPDRLPDIRKANCNQCGEQMKEAFIYAIDQGITYPACRNPKCPNFALLQIPQENL